MKKLPYSPWLRCRTRRLKHHAISAQGCDKPRNPCMHAAVMHEQEHARHGGRWRLVPGVGRSGPACGIVCNNAYALLSMYVHPISTEATGRCHHLHASWLRPKHRRMRRRNLQPRATRNVPATCHAAVSVRVLSGFEHALEEWLPELAASSGSRCTLFTAYGNAMDIRD